MGQVQMTKAQEKMVKSIRRVVEYALDNHNEKFENQKELVSWEVTDEEYFIAVNFKVNYVGEELGHYRNELRGQLFVRERGGLRGQIRTLGNKADIKSGGEFYKIAMWI
jgi:hypothetical protein